MIALLSVITIGIDPTIELGPVTLAWHGLTIAVGIAVGAPAVAHDARRRGLDPERVYAIGGILVIGALVGGRAFFLLEHGELDDPGAWFGTTGFTFYGGFIAAALGIVYYLRRVRLSVSYEVLIGAIVFAIVWPLRKRLQRPLALMWLMLGLFATGRFFEFFLRSDSADLALGLEVAQWTSLVLLAVVAAGAWLTLRRQQAAPEAPT